MSAILFAVLALLSSSGAQGARTFGSREEAGDPLPTWFTADEPLEPLEQEGRALKASHCGPLTKELVLGVAKNNTVLVTVVDNIVWKCFGPSWVENVQSANITYWLVGALDPETSMALGAMGVTAHCFNAPPERLKYKGTDSTYAWGSNHWTQTTWNKVHIIKNVYEYGVHVIHSDSDVTWFNDPIPYFFSPRMAPIHIAMATDALSTGNPEGYVGPEVQTSPHWNINTGIYFFRNWEGGLDFFNMWLSWQPRNIGHDQDGFNLAVRGAWFRGDQGMPTAIIPPDMHQNHYFLAAFANTTAITFLPVSSFANAYTYVNARLAEQLKQPLYEVHWVWGGSNMESKRQNMRDALKFHDEPEYYTEGTFLSFDLTDALPAPEGFNTWDMLKTEEMVRFHVAAGNQQLQQAYYAFAAALVANRTLVMPRFLCYCAKNWYQTQACRINHEKATKFPFVCALSQLMRVKRLEMGLTLPGSTDYSGHRVHIREYSFLENPKVPDAIKKSYVEVVASDQPRPPGNSQPPELLLLKTEPSPKGYGHRVTVAAPLNDVELRALLAMSPFKEARVIHMPKPHKILSGFVRPETHRQYDDEIQKRVARWCCRSPADMKSRNLTDNIQFNILPQDRMKNLAPLPMQPRSCYLHELGPIQPYKPGDELPS
ncbi:hypothetical protein HYH03_009709 [Edaphochlamys debaryana]|uniref:Glycosyltransferase n=1 Tax=Edaphochlamys debaryana TaxID=47281 RepID=A0A835XZP8_9CHLO|nr:hypothetical protein HYH03_009709 [Edaphochlamys debaryana]|eukprot:KAG2491978.1 hypothetical protein HYH03_009709 [Edaphochlamys debaryana]